MKKIKNEKKDKIKIYINSFNNRNISNNKNHMLDKKDEKLLVESITYLLTLSIIVIPIVIGLFNKNFYCSNAFLICSSILTFLVLTFVFINNRKN